MNKGIVRVSAATAKWLRFDPIAQFCYAGEKEVDGGQIDITLVSARFDAVGEGAEPPYYSITVQGSQLGHHVTEVSRVTMAPMNGSMEGDLFPLYAGSGVVFRT